MDKYGTFPLKLTVGDIKNGLISEVHKETMKTVSDGLAAHKDADQIANKLGQIWKSIWKSTLLDDHH